MFHFLFENQCGDARLAQWCSVSTVASRQEGSRMEPSGCLGSSEWSLHVLPAWVLSSPLDSHSSNTQASLTYSRCEYECEWLATCLLSIQYMAVDNEWWFSLVRFYCRCSVMMILFYIQKIKEHMTVCAVEDRMRVYFRCQITVCLSVHFSCMNYWEPTWEQTMMCHPF